MNNLGMSIALAVAMGSLATAQDPRRPVLRAGVSVQMAATQNAVALPEADQPDALVVAVTARGSVYLGITPVRPADLPAGVAGGPRIYIKADARAPFAAVAEVLAALRQAGIASPWLLTAQQESPQPGHPVPPKGLEVRLGPATAESAVEVRVRAAGSSPYADVVRVIDACRGAGAAVLLATPAAPSK